MSKSTQKTGKSVFVKGGLRMLKRTNTMHTSTAFNNTIVRPNIQRSGSITSLNSDIEEEGNTPNESMTRRGRRAAINICDQEQSNRTCQDTEAGQSGQPTDDHPPSLEMRVGVLPGVDILKEQQNKILKKQHTIADLTAKAYNSSNASFSEDTKRRSGISFLKIIDKKAKSRESLVDLQEALTHLVVNDFHDGHLITFKEKHWSDLIPNYDKTAGSISKIERKRREAVWELFTSELVFFLDHLMVLKHCFMEPLKALQVDGHLMFVEPQDIFCNLDELCYVSYTFCKDLINILTADKGNGEFGSTSALLQALIRWSNLSKEGEVFHNYCLNYDCAITYLDILRKYEQFLEFEKWSEHDSRCNRLQITDLLVAPIQHYTKIPLLLGNIRKYTDSAEEKNMLTENLEKVETSLKNLEDKMRWLKNYERLQEIQLQLIWPSIMELEPRTFIPEFLKHILSKQPCERLIANPKRQLLHEGFLMLNDGNKAIEVYTFLFDDLLLITKIKKPPKKKSIAEHNLQTRSPTEGALFVVYRQPIALDRFSIHDIGIAEASANGLRNAFVLVTMSRFQQITGVYTIQSNTDSSKVMWLEQLRDSQQKFQEKLKVKLNHGDSSTTQTNKHSKLLNKIQKLQFQHHQVEMQTAEDMGTNVMDTSPQGCQMAHSSELTTSPDSQTSGPSFSPNPILGLSVAEPRSVRSSLTGCLYESPLDEEDDNEVADVLSSPNPGLTPRRSGPQIESLNSLPGLRSSLGPSRLGSDKSVSPNNDHSYLVTSQPPSFSPPLSPTLHSFDKANSFESIDNVDKTLYEFSMQGFSPRNSLRQSLIGERRSIDDRSYQRSSLSPNVKRRSVKEVTICDVSRLGDTTSRKESNA